MDSNSLYQVVQDLDEYLGSVKPSELKEDLLKHFLELRNNLLKKYSPDPSLNWEIQNKNILKILNGLNWKRVWITCE